MKWCGVEEWWGDVMSGERSSGNGCWCGLKVQVDEWGEIIRAGVLVWAEGTSWWVGRDHQGTGVGVGWRYKLMSGERSSGHRCWCGLKVQVDEWGEIIRARVLVWAEGTSWWVGRDHQGTGVGVGWRYKLMSGERSSGHGYWCGLKVQVDEWGEIIRAWVLVWTKGTSWWVGRDHQGTDVGVGWRYKLMSGVRSSGHGCWCGLKVQVDEWGEIITARVLVWAEGTSWWMGRDHQGRGVSVGWR